MAVNLSPIGGVAGQFFDNNGNPLVGGKLYTYSAGTTTPQVTYTSATGVTPNSNPIILNGGGRVPAEIWLTDGLQYKFVLYTSTDTLIGSWDNIIGINSNFVNFVTSEEVQTATAGQTIFTLTTMQYQPGLNNLVVYVDGVNQVEGGTYSFVETSSTVVTFTSGLHLGAIVKFVSAETLTTVGSNANVIAYEPAGAGAVTTTVQAKLRETVSVKDFGAVGDGVTDDTAAIQAFFNYVTANGRRGILQNGDYLITAPLVISTLTTINNFSIEGETEVSPFQSNVALGTRFLWAGANGATVMSFTNCRDCQVSGIFVTPATTQTIGSCIVIDGTNSVKFRVSIGCSPRSGVITNGVHLSPTATTGCDIHYLYNLAIDRAVNGVMIGNNGQCKFNLIERSNIVMCTNGINQLAGSFTVDNCNFGSNAVDINMASVTDNINIYAPQSELSGRFLRCSDVASAAMAINIYGGRLFSEAPNINADGKYIFYEAGGPVNLFGVDFASGRHVPSWTMYVYNSAGGGTAQSALNAFGCVFPTTTPYTQTTDSVAMLLGCRVVALGGGQSQLSYTFDAGNFSTKSTFVVGTAPITPADGATTLNAALGSDFIIGVNSAPTALTAITGGKRGQTVTIVGADNTNPTTIADGGNFALSAAITLNANTAITLKTYDGTQWLEMCRSVN